MLNFGSGGESVHILAARSTDTGLRLTDKISTLFSSRGHAVLAESWFEMMQVKWSLSEVKRAAVDRRLSQLWFVR